MIFVFQMFTLKFCIDYEQSSAFIQPKVWINKRGRRQSFVSNSIPNLQPFFDGAGQQIKAVRTAKYPLSSHSLQINPFCFFIQHYPHPQRGCYSLTNIWMNRKKAQQWPRFRMRNRLLKEIVSRHTFFSHRLWRHFKWSPERHSCYFTNPFSSRPHTPRIYFAITITSQLMKGRGLWVKKNILINWRVTGNGAKDQKATECPQGRAIWWCCSDDDCRRGKHFFLGFVCIFLSLGSLDVIILSCWLLLWMRWNNKMIPFY